MILSEAERQLLSTLKRSLDAGLPTDRDSLETAGKRFEAYKEDRNEAFASLTEAGLIGHGKGFGLISKG